jgi:hypothetical protein
VRSAIALLVVLVSASGRHRAKEAPVSLVLSRFGTNGQGGSTTWVLDDRGRQFVLSKEKRLALEPAGESLVLSLAAVGEAIQSARAIPPKVPAAEVDRARSLIAVADRSTARVHEPEPMCNDCGTTEIFGYLPPSPQGIQRVVLLSHIYGLWHVDENLSPQAQELIKLVNRLQSLPASVIR